MTLETESILDRRRLRRKLGFWRGLAIVVLVGALGWVAIRIAAPEGLTTKPQIARITVTGLITADRKQLKLLKKIAKADHVKGVIVHVNSPGGTTTGGEALYEGLRALSKKKPVVAQFGTVAASAAYITGLATDHIVARGNSITGSIGVIMQWPELTGLLDKLGVKMHEIKSGKLKAAPSPFMPVDEEARKVAEDMVLGRARDVTNVSPALPPYQEVTDENVRSFHYHGPETALPLTAIIAVPRDEKAATLLRARMQGSRAWQMVDPTRVIDDLMQFVFRIRALFDAFEDKPLPDWAAEFDCRNWAQFFLKFIVSHPAVTCAIPATSRVDHMAENMGAAYGRLPDPDLRARMVRYVEDL